MPCILKYVWHISNYVRHIFRLLQCGYNALKFSFQFSLPENDNISDYCRHRISAIYRARAGSFEKARWIELLQGWWQCFPAPRLVRACRKPLLQHFIRQSLNRIFTFVKKLQLNHKIYQNAKASALYIKKELSLRRIVLGTSAQADEKQKNNSNNNQTHYKYG